MSNCGTEIQPFERLGFDDPEYVWVMSKPSEPGEPSWAVELWNQDLDSVELFRFQEMAEAEEVAATIREMLEEIVRDEIAWALAQATAIGSTHQK